MGMGRGRGRGRGRSSEPLLSRRCTLAMPPGLLRALPLVVRLRDLGHCEGPRTHLPSLIAHFLGTQDSRGRGWG